MYIISYFATFFKLFNSSDGDNENNKINKTIDNNNFKLEEGDYLKKPPSYKNINTSSYKLN